jgi:hypothetical protein
MMTTHDKAHDATGAALAVALAAVFFLTAGSLRDDSRRFALLQSRLEQVAPGSHRVPRDAWPPLGQEKTIRVGEALKGEATASILCGSPACADLAADIDDALQIAGWRGEVVRAPFIVGADEAGILVGPPDREQAKALAAALGGVGLPARLEPLAGSADVVVLIGRRK